MMRRSSNLVLALVGLSLVGCSSQLQNDNSHRPMQTSHLPSSRQIFEFNSERKLKKQFEDRQHEREVHLAAERARKFDYVIDNVQHNHSVSNFRLVQAGMTIDQVKELLGDPNEIEKYMLSYDLSEAVTEFAEKHKLLVSLTDLDTVYCVLVSDGNTIELLAAAWIGTDSSQ